ncbi:MAG: helix-turn-helix transcriptional regulator [Bacteroidetes bacterium]|nr:helix-turn-helix transcriptional regulator [Bacteroidota bacterium]
MPDKKQTEPIDIMRHRLPYPEVVKALEAQLRTYEAQDYKKGIMETKLQLAVADIDFRALPEVRQLLTDCEAYILRYGSMEQKGLLFFARGRVLSFEGQYEEGLFMAIKALHYFLPTDVHEFTTKCYLLCGIECRHLDMYNECLEYMNKAVEVSQKAGIKGMTAMCMQNVNEVKMDLLPAPEAIRSMNDFLKYLREIYEGKDNFTEALTLLCLSELYLRQQDVAKAKEVFAQSEAIKQRLGSAMREMDYRNRRAAIAAAEGDEKAMLHHTAQAIEMAGVQGSVQGEVWSYTILFDYYIAHGQTATAKKHLDKVRKVLKTKSPTQLDKNLSPLLVKYYHATGDVRSELQYIQAVHQQQLERQQQLTTARLRHATAVHEIELRDMEHQIMRRELNLKSQELNLSNHYLQHRNDLLDDLKECITTMQKDNARRETVFQTLFSKIDVAYAREDNEKDLFRQKFDAAQADFIRALTKKYPTLSPAESRICALMHQGFANKEIATLLSTTLRNVETHRLNIRKKLKLKRADSLQLVLAGIGE